MNQQVTLQKVSSAKQISITAISAALFALMFYFSGFIAMPQFTFLYLPIILLGVFPIWFGRNGLIGSAIGAFIGGVFVEGLGIFGFIEVFTAVVIYALTWLLLPKNSEGLKSTKHLVLNLAVYAATLFVGTCVILFQLTGLGFMTVETAQVMLLPVFALNYVIEAIVCPILNRALTPTLKNWGIYSGTFWDKRNNSSKP
jgi:hypothetical protein